MVHLTTHNILDSKEDICFRRNVTPQTCDVDVITLGVAIIGSDVRSVLI